MALTNVEDIQALAKMKYNATAVYFISSAGNDANGGLANNAANALLTLEQAIVLSASPVTDVFVIVDEVSVAADLSIDQKVIGACDNATSTLYVINGAVLTFTGYPPENIFIVFHKLLPPDGKSVIFDLGNSFPFTYLIKNCKFNYTKGAADTGILFTSAVLSLENCEFNVTMSAAGTTRTALDFVGGGTGTFISISNCKFNIRFDPSLDAATDDVYALYFKDGYFFRLENNEIDFVFNSAHAHNNKKYIIYAEDGENFIMKNNKIRNNMLADYDGTSIDNEMVGIFIKGYEYSYLSGNSINQIVAHTDNVNYDIKIDDTTPVYGALNIYDPDKVSGTIQGLLPNTELADIDSTGSPITLSKAVEVILAAIAGNSTTNASGTTSFKGRDGTTEIISVTTIGDGIRTASTVP